MKVIFPFLLCALSVTAQPNRTASMDANDWHIEANRDTRSLVISYTPLGTLLANIKLGSLGDSGKLQFFDRWDLVEANGNRLSIRTHTPQTGWEFEVSNDTLKISTTADVGMLTAEAPAPNSRIPVRTMDTSGTPVIWQGTAEVARQYDGAMTRSASYLSRTNGQAMYLSLGAVDGRQFHSLFDRASDAAIEFTDDTQLEREHGDPNKMKVTMRIPGSSDIRVVNEYYTKHLGVPFYTPFDDSRFKTAPMVWSSWTSYYEAVTEADIVRNADWLAAHLKPYGFQYVQLDDGYDRVDRAEHTGEHTWIGDWDKNKFPHGPEWLTKYIKSKGLRAGLWLVPNAYADGVASHPDWYLHNKNGKITLDYNTPTLDSTNPEVIQFLKHLFTTLDDWGFDYYKFDGEFAAAKYIPGVDKSRLHDTSVDLMENYRERLKVISQTIGPDRFIEGCPAGTPLNGVGYFNSYFNGDDLYNNWQGMYPLFSSINANAFLNHILVYVMPGEGLELTPPQTVEETAKNRPHVVIDTAHNREANVLGFGTSMAEARTLVTYISLTGVAYPLASVMPEVSEERVQLLKATMPTLPILPMDLFSRGTDMTFDKFKSTTADFYIHHYPELLDLKVNNSLGAYDVVALTNWRSQKASRELLPEQTLGLPGKGPYLAFDFWNKKFLGAFDGHMNIDVDSHDTRVVLVHRQLNHPQLLGTSRHLTGGYSLEDVAWNQDAHSLSGKSLTVANDPYSLWIHVPDGTSLKAVNANVPVSQKRDGDLVTLTFTGTGSPVKWKASF